MIFFVSVFSLLSEIYDWRGYRISTEIKNLVEGMINLLGRTCTSAKLSEQKPEAASPRAGHLPNAPTITCICLEVSNKYSPLYNPVWSHCQIQCKHYCATDLKSKIWTFSRPFL